MAYYPVCPPNSNGTTPSGSLTVAPGNDTVLRLRQAQAIDLTTGLPVPLDESAVVTFRVQTPDYVDVAGETWPVLMNYILGSQGDFVGVLRETVALEPGLVYRFIGEVDNGVDQHGHWDLPLYVVPRGA